MWVLWEELHIEVNYVSEAVRLPLRPKAWLYMWTAIHLIHGLLSIQETNSPDCLPPLTCRKKKLLSDSSGPSRMRVLQGQEAMNSFSDWARSIVVGNRALCQYSAKIRPRNSPHLSCSIERTHFWRPKPCKVTASCRRSGSLRIK